MKINCSIADDLLPLYIDGTCSEGSKAALEQHLEGCSACRRKLERMRDCSIARQTQKCESNGVIHAYAKKIKRRRIRVGIFFAFAGLLAACILALCFLAIMDMRTQANPEVYQVEEGACNLAAGDLITTAAQIGGYILYTNSEQIKVSIATAADEFSAEFLLWDVTYENSPAVIGHGAIGPGADACIFTNLSASRRYRVTCDADGGVNMIVGEGRVVSFWRSLKDVLYDVFQILG